MGNETCIPNTLNLHRSLYHSGAKLQILNATALENIQTGHKSPGQGDPRPTAQAQPRI